MGNKTSSNTVPQLADDGTRSLCERDAWKLATAWHPLIHRAVSVQEDCSYTILCSQEYVTWNFESRFFPHRNLESMVLAARAATICWFAISSCPGFGGEENPEFWRRVLDAHDRASKPRYMDLHDSCVDAGRFFRNVARPFPSVHIKPPNNQDCLIVHLFMFGSLPHEWPRTDKLLKKALRKLRPFICSSRWARDLPLAFSPSSIKQGVRAIEEAAKRASTKTHKRSQHADSVVQLHINECTDLRDVITSTTRLLENHNPATPRVRVNTLKLDAKLSALKVYAAACSALPHTKTLAGICVDFEANSDDAIYAAWLGYALFHPDVEVHDTSIRDLTLALWRFGVTRTLETMSQGNNLLLALGATTIQSSSYHQARVGVDTCVRFGELQSKHARKYRLQADAWVSVCFKDPIRASVEGERHVRVVIPGLGLGWIKSSSVLEVVARPPAKSCVRRLILSAPPKQPYPASVPSALLATLGSRLEFLDISSHKDMTAEAVQAMLPRCPALKRLKLSQDGSCWAHRECPGGAVHPRLEELSLTIQTSLRPLTAPQLRGLTLFELIVDDASGSVRDNRESFISLLETCPKLQYVVCLKMRARQRRVSRLRGMSLYALNDVVMRGIHDVATVDLSKPSRVAFLSVVCAHADAANENSHAVSRLPPEVIDHMFHFSSSCVPRKFLTSQY